MKSNLSFERDLARLFADWGIPCITIGSGTLVPREYAAPAIRKIYSHNYILLGYDAFTVFHPGTRQPHLSYSASYSEKRPRALEEALESTKDDPSEVTHYEFVFRRGA